MGLKKYSYYIIYNMSTGKAIVFRGKGFQPFTNSQRKRLGMKSMRTRRASRNQKGRSTKYKYQIGTYINPFRLMNYNETNFTISLTNLAQIGFLRFRGNSLYDCYYETGGSQPYGFDQICPTFYKRYQVVASKIKVIAYADPSNSLPTSHIKLMVLPYSETSLPYTEANDIMAVRGCRTQVINYYGDKSSPPIVNNYTTTRKVLGKAMADSDLATAQYNNNPTNMWYWFIFMDMTGQIGGGDSTQLMHLDVQIKYYTKFSQTVELDDD